MSLPILCYHNVAPFEVAGRRLNIEPLVLDSHVRHFRRKQMAFVRACELNGPWPERAVCFTFDDAYASMLNHGVEALRRYGAAGSIYAVSSLIGQGSIWDVGNEKPLAGLDQLVAASKLGFEIANHTASHADLSALNEQQQQVEMQTAQNALLSAGFESASIAFPFGKFNEYTEVACRAAGLGIGLALSRRPATPSDNRFAMPRIVVGFDDRLPKLLYKIHLRQFLPVFRKREHYV